MELTLMDVHGKTSGTLSLDDAVWSGKANLKLLAQAAAMYRANLRAGSASTKKRGEVSGGGKKPWKQKHTGRARAGSTRSPLWRHGGVVFGPQPRDYSYSLPQAIRRRALLESLKGKLQDEELVVLNEITAKEPKTKPFAGLAKTFGATRKSVIVLDEWVVPVVKSLRNLPKFSLRRANELNAFDVLNAHKVLITKAAFERVQQRVADPANGGVKEQA